MSSVNSLGGVRKPDSQVHRTVITTGDVAQVPKQGPFALVSCATLGGSKRGRYGFDDGNETCGACRDGSQSRKSKAAN